MKRHPRIRKTIKWGGAAVPVLLVGVVLTGATVVAGAIFPDFYPEMHVRYGNFLPPIMISKQRGLGVASRFAIPESVKDSVLQQLPEDWYARDASIADVAALSPVCDRFMFIETHAGWPMRCAVGSATVGYSPQVRVLSHAAIASDHPTLTQPFVRFVPYGPLWMGCLINVACWSAAVWLISRTLLLPHIVLQAWRRRAGLCPKCGYDRTGLVGGKDGGGAKCPECGVGGSGSGGRVSSPLEIARF